MARAWWRLVRSGAATITRASPGSVVRNVGQCSSKIGGSRISRPAECRAFFSGAQLKNPSAAAAPCSAEQEEAQYKCITKLARQDLNLEEVEACLKDVEAAYPPDDTRLGTIYIRMGQLFDLHGGSPEKLSLCGERALKAVKDGSMESAMCYHLLATSYHKSDQSERCVETLQKVFEIIKKKGKEDSGLKYAADFLHGDALADMGKYELALKSFLSGIALQEKVDEESHSKLGDNYRRVAEALTQLARAPEAVEFAEKAVRSHQKHFGEKSLAEAADRRLLAVLYKGLDKHEAAVEENKLVRDILVHNERAEEARLIDIGIAVCQISLKQYEEASATLKAILKDPKSAVLVQGLAHVNLAKISQLLKDNEEAEMHADRATTILKKNKSGSMMVAEGFVELAAVFESMDDRDTSLELLVDASGIFASIPGQLNAVAGTESQIGMLYYNMRKLDEALPHMKKAAKIYEDVFGNEHVALGCVENQMGVANMELKNFKEAVEHFHRANKIYMKKRGPEHVDTMAVNHNLVLVYTELQRWDRAIFFQQRIVNEMEQKGDVKQLDQERKILMKLQRARGHNTFDSF